MSCPPSARRFGNLRKSSRNSPAKRQYQNALCSRHGASLGAVREALSRLGAEGPVVSEPQRGFQAASISIDELKDLTFARVEIECLCLRMAVQKGDLAWEERLLGISHRLMRTQKQAQDDPQRLSDQWARAHAAFHEALVAACASPTLLQVRCRLYAQSERSRRLSIPLAEMERDLDGEHRAIAAAALDRDIPTTLRLMQAHIEQTTHILLHAHDWRTELVA